MYLREEKDQGYVYYAGWLYNPDLGPVVSTYSMGATATFRFRGTNATWKTIRTSTSGKTDVYLDGKKVKTFDGYAPSDQTAVTGYAKRGLPEKQHTLKLVNTGAKNVASEDFYTDIQAFLVGARTFLTNSPNISYGPWKGATNSSASGGAYRESADPKYPAGFYPFTGPTLRFITATGPTRGEAVVVVCRADTGELVQQQTFNLKTSSVKWKVAKDITGLDPAVKYVAMVSSNDGAPVVVDAFKSYNNPSYNAVGDFSATQNPDGAWSYGYHASGGSGFVVYTNHSTPYAGLERWSVTGASEPMVAHNGAGRPLSYATIVHPPDLLNLHPGPSLESSVVRWTAPAPGVVEMEGRFEGIDTVGTTTDVVVGHSSPSGAAVLFRGNVNGYGATAPFSITKPVGAGDTINFYVSSGTSNYAYDSTGLSATIVLVP